MLPSRVWKSPPAAFSALCCAHVLLLRSARQTMVAPFGMHQAIGGLAGRAFLTILPSVTKAREVLSQERPFKCF